ncbi:nuclear pore complex protein Nup98-Nup96 [Dorcoceras hygrometricum]|uniref:Nuclear pore complex protein Nup98-Nup96 n=1 Tax=Dorcoceras hygrometricum TaxID=472368 RepID=A0A2Z7C319_9LAMI|nr:nuclear pore complex protein Nup98-Nup96 [Dorcoceras hygrometricum]
MGIDQLKFQSVQLGYLKILQLGNIDPNNKSRKRKYEVKPQNRSRRPANQLEVHLNRASIAAQCINRGNHRFVIIRPVSHHSSVVLRHNQSVGHHSDDTVGPFRQDTSVCRSQRGSNSASSQTDLNNMKYRHDHAHSCLQQLNSYLQFSSSTQQISPGMAASAYKTASSLITAQQYSRDFPKAQIQKLTRAGDCSTQLSREHTNSQPLRASPLTSIQST